MKKKSSVITPPPALEEGQGSQTSEALSDDQRKEALIKLVRKGAPSVPQEPEGEDIPSERARFSIRLHRTILERVGTAAKQTSQKRRIEIPVNTWMTEAILEKLKREGV